MESYRRFLRGRDAASPMPGSSVSAGGGVGARDPVRRAAARDDAVAWACAVAADRDAVYVDTETTGIASHDEVIEIAVIGNDGRTLFETLLKPSQPIPPAVVAIHGITDADVANAPTLPEAIAELLPWLEGRLAVVYNAPFDRRMIEQTCRRHGAPAPAVRYDCAMRRYASFAAVARAGSGGYRWHKLEQAARAFGQPPGGHRAAADARATRQVVHGMAAHRDPDRAMLPDR